MKKVLIAVAVVLGTAATTFAQRPAGAGSEKFNSLSPEQQATILAKRTEARAKWQAMTPNERNTLRAQLTANGTDPNSLGRPAGRGGRPERFNSLSPEKQAEIMAMKEKVKNMTPEERRAFFQNGGGRPRN